MNRQKALYFAFLPWIITECTSEHRKSEGCGMQSAISRTTGGGGIHGDDGNKRNYTVYSMKGLNIFFLFVFDKSRDFMETKQWFEEEV